MIVIVVFKRKTQNSIILLIKVIKFHKIYKINRIPGNLAQSLKILKIIAHLQIKMNTNKQKKQFR